MWLLVYVPAVLGVLRYRTWPYWRWVGVMMLWQTAAQLLFDSHGTLEDPSRDGLISRILRQATDNGPAFAAYGLVFLVIFYGGVAYIVRRLYVEARAAAYTPEVSPTSKGRKALEITGLTALFGALIYLNIAALWGTDRAIAASSGQSLEAELDKAVALLNKQTPAKLDDVTTLTRVSRQGRMVIYDYSVALAATREGFSDFLQSEVIPQGCANEGNQDMLRAGATIRYRYQLASGGEPLSADITDQVCRDRPPPQKNSSISR